MNGHIYIFQEFEHYMWRRKFFKSMFCSIFILCIIAFMSGKVLMLSNSIDAEDAMKYDKTTTQSFTATGMYVMPMKYNIIA